MKCLCVTSPFRTICYTICMMFVREAHMKTTRDSNRPPMLWTPWGEQKIAQPGEKFAALRRLALRLRKSRQFKLAQQKPAAN